MSQVAYKTTMTPYDSQLNREKKKGKKRDWRGKSDKGWEYTSIVQKSNKKKSILDNLF